MTDTELLRRAKEALETLAEEYTQPNRACTVCTWDSGPYTLFCNDHNPQRHVAAVIAEIEARLLEGVGETQ